VYSFGWNQNGDLGIGNTKNKNSPQKINFENNEKIFKIFTYCYSHGAFFYSSFYFIIFFNFLINFLILIFLILKKIKFCFLVVILLTKK
jgi:hypothetical protein